jgi:hypothetical protein
VLVQFDQWVPVSAPVLPNPGPWLDGGTTPGPAARGLLPCLHMSTDFPLRTWNWAATCWAVLVPWAFLLLWRMPAGHPAVMAGLALLLMLGFALLVPLGYDFQDSGLRVRYLLRRRTWGWDEVEIGPHLLWGPTELLGLRCGRKHFWLTPADVPLPLGKLRAQVCAFAVQGRLVAQDPVLDW